MDVCKVDGVTLRQIKGQKGEFRFMYATLDPATQQVSSVTVFGGPQWYRQWSESEQRWISVGDGQYWSFAPERVHVPKIRKPRSTTAKKVTAKRSRASK